MKYMPTLALFVTLILSVTHLSAGKKYYKTLDKQGNVVFTDQKPKGKSYQALELPSAQVIDSPKIKEKKELAQQEHPVIEYKGLEILSPTAKQHIHNQDKIRIKVDAKPGLEKGDVIALYLDGQLATPASDKTEFALPIPDRGEHKLQAKILNKSGKELKTSSLRTFYVHRPSALTAP